MPYPGGKESAGTYQRLINQIPPHRIYVEPFVGGGAILRHKRPAEQSYAIDLDPGALAALGDGVPQHTCCIHACGIDWLLAHRERLDPAAFVYCDPPYLPEVCASRCRYTHGLDRDGHVRLLDVLRTLRCPVMLSGYWSDLYAEKLADWRTFSFAQMTRGGYEAEEWVWCNYAEPVALHDYRYLGENFRQRERFRRQQKRWRAKLARMDRLQRQALLSAIAAGGEADSGQWSVGSGQCQEASPQPARECSGARIAGNGDVDLTAGNGDGRGGSS